jgi:hypothetical protein
MSATHRNVQGIPDPYGHTMTAFRASVRQLLECVDSVLERLEREGAYGERYRRTFVAEGSFVARAALASLGRELRNRCLRRRGCHG